MIFDWIGRQMDAVIALLTSGQVMLVLGSLLATWLVVRVLLATVHRPWQSAYWTLYPLGVAVAAVALILLLWPGQPRWALALSCVVSCAGAAWLALGVSGRVRRARQIVVPGLPGKPQKFEADSIHLDRPPAAGGRRIVIFCDGTSNRPDQKSDGVPAPTNVCRLSDDLIRTEKQTGWYDAGVGSETSSEAVAGATAGRIAAMIGWLQASRAAGLFTKVRTVSETAFGVGITENIVQAYAEIVRQYRPGDRIYLLGFSRGAYTARCVAGVIGRCGLLRAENIRYAPDVVRLFRTRKATNKNVPIRSELVHASLPAIEFLGLFDTVGSLGVPMWGWWFNWRLFFRNSPLSTDPSPICLHVYHAMAMDERRAQFFPTPFDRPGPTAWTRTLEQVWFRGCHCDVGGGYADNGLSDIALAWMLHACERHGLIFGGEVRRTLRPDPLARMHDELQRQPAWRLLGSWPRWHPVSGSLHPSVLRRAEALHALDRHDMRPVGCKPLAFTAGAQREWDRTGLVLAGIGQRYRLTWKEGKWCDKECLPCGPAGQPGRELMRWLFRFRRRLPRENYMTLCIAIAHPRLWPLREGGLVRLARYLFLRDPKEMREQVAPVGRDLLEPGDSVVIQNNADDGILYLFANDSWMTAANNSGGLELTIERLAPDSDVTAPLWTLSPVIAGKRRPTGWRGTHNEAWRWRRSA